MKALDFWFGVFGVSAGRKQTSLSTHTSLRISSYSHSLAPDIVFRVPLCLHQAGERLHTYLPSLPSCFQGFSSSCVIPITALLVTADKESQHMKTDTVSDKCCSSLPLPVPYSFTKTKMQYTGSHLARKTGSYENNLSFVFHPTQLF